MTTLALDGMDSVRLDFPSCADSLACGSAHNCIGVATPRKNKLDMQIVRGRWKIIQSPFGQTRPRAATKSGGVQLEAIRAGLKGAKQIFRFSCAMRKILCSTWTNLQHRARYKSWSKPNLIQPCVPDQQPSPRDPRGLVKHHRKSNSLGQVLLKTYSMHRMQT
jgi:hypothetical protein